MKTEISPIRDCAVVGAGPAGLAAALGLALRGLRPLLVGDAPGIEADDGRTAALFNSSIMLLRSIGVWDDIAGLCEPLRAIRIVDDTGGLLRAPEVVFAARDVGADAFGWNVPNGALTAALWEKVSRSDELTVLKGRVSGLTWDGDHVVLSVGEETTARVRLVGAADGRGSVCRTAAGIGTRAWNYDQAAITTRFAHSRPHRGVSTEIQRRSGPCTTVPLPGNASSLVWVEEREAAGRLSVLDDGAFRAALEARLDGLLGSIGEIAPRHCFALSGLAAMEMAAKRVALIGEAGHVMPPIGAQGLNLGLRDAGWLVEFAGDAVARGVDPGGPGVLESYRRARSGDVQFRMAIVDALNRSLLSDFAPVGLARGFGLHVLAAVPALKRLVIRQGMAASRELPSMMADIGAGR